MITKTYAPESVTVTPKRRIAGVVISSPNVGDPITVDVRFHRTESIGEKVISNKEINLTRNAAQIDAVPAVKNAIDVLLQWVDAQQDVVETAAVK